MKFLFLIVAFACFFSVQGQGAGDAALQCVQESGVSITSVSREIDYSQNDPKLKHYFFCLMNKMGQVDDKGRFIPPQGAEFLRGMVEQCTGNPDDKYESAWLVSKCLAEQAKAH